MAFPSPRFLLAACVVLAGFVALASCIGDDPALVASTADSGNDALAGEQDGGGTELPPPDAGGPPDAAGGDAHSGPRCTPGGGWGTPAPVSELNTISSRNMNAHLSVDELTVHFASDRLRDGGVGAFAGFDLFRATRTSPDGTFGTPVRIPLSDPDVPDIGASETADGKTIYFDTYRPSRGVWVATRAAVTSDFADPQAVAGINNGGGENGAPFVLSDHSAVYFATSRVVGQSFEIFRAEINGGLVGAVATVEGVNSEASDTNPVATVDDLTLYFASARDNGGSAHDIFVATRASTTATFGSLTKLPATINVQTGGTTANRPSYVTADECVLYFTRLTGGQEQIWRVKRD
jgi:hypothetical protein